MSTASQIEREHAIAATAGVVRNPDGAATGEADHRTTCLAAAEAVVAAAVEMARQATTAAQATVAAAAALRIKMEQEPVGGSRSLAGRRPLSWSSERRCGHRGRSLVARPVVQTVYHDSRVGMPWTMLTRTNYHE